MTKSELKQYLLNNRDDKEALKELKSRPKQNVITLTADLTTEEQKRILRQTISDIKSN
jgi:hypothetical protein